MMSANDNDSTKKDTAYPGSGIDYLVSVGGCCTMG